MTTWSPLTNFPGYEVSDAGRVRSVTRQLPVVFRKPANEQDPFVQAQPTHTIPPEDPTVITVTPPTRARGAASLNVMDYGAVGDGVHDDTAAFQAAINALPADGGTVTAPAGNYLVDGNPTKCVKPRAKMLLFGSPGANLIIKPNNLDRSYGIYIYKVNDVEIDGFTILGERDQHVGTTGEWGMGIQSLGGKRVTLKNLHISKCWGDGICLGSSGTTQGDDVFVSNVVCTQNRRQGLSSTKCNNVKIYDSEFSYTQGTSPECGIDIEPDPPSSASTIRIENCRLHHNKMYGINVFARVSGVTIKGCTVEYNGSNGIVTVQCSDIELVANTIRYNSATGLVVQSGTVNLLYHDNLSYGNYSRQGIKVRTPFSQTGWTKTLQRDIIIQAGTTNVVIGTSNYQ